MSLINDMLRDLDKRGGRNPQDADTGSGHADRANLSAIGGRSHRSLSSWLPALAAFVLVAALVVWEQNRRGDEQAASSVAAGDEQQAAYSATETLSSSSEATELIMAPNFNPGLPATKAPAQTEKAPDQGPVVEQLMRDADRALERDRLTSPIEDNAYARYQQVLELAPEHPGARRGMARITRRYLDLTENYIERGNALRAEVLLRRARTVQAEHPDIAAVAERLAILFERGASAGPTPAQTSVSASSATREAERTAPEAPNKQAMPGQLTVTPNADSLDRQTAQQAQHLISQGRQHSARLRLEKLLEEYPGSPRSAALLAKIYLDQGDLDSARQLLANGDFLPIDERTQLLAQLAIAEGRSEIAIDLLEQRLDLASENESYRAMLAGLYYRANRHAEAASHYRRLLDSFGAKPAYWLGLALALDAQNIRPSALEAYRRAQASGFYNAEGQGEVRDYIERRVATLERQGN